jgi:hypothetical protein
VIVYGLYACLPCKENCGDDDRCICDVPDEMWDVSLDEFWPKCCHCRQRLSLITPLVPYETVAS